jgi:ABC-type glycerol-3-phosphate transport system substrate-binding protein
VAVLPTGTWYRNQSLLQTDISSMAWPTWQWGPNKATWFGTHTFMIPATQQGEKLNAVLKMIRWVSEHQVDWAASGQVPARLSAQKALDPVNYPSNILLGNTFSEYGIQDPRTTVTQELLSLMDAGLQEALNNIKPLEQALNDAVVLMQQALDRG